MRANDDAPPNPLLRRDRWADQLGCIGSVVICPPQTCGEIAIHLAFVCLAFYPILALAQVDALDAYQNGSRSEMFRCLRASDNLKR